MTTTATFADQRDEYNAGLAEQAPADVLDGFRRIIADQAAVDYSFRAPKVGDPAPDFTLHDQLGRQVSLAGELEQGPVVLIFYRGEWCPYCNMMLRTYGLRAADFSARGARVVAVSPQTPDNSLTMAEKHSLEFPVLSDERGEVIGTYGLKYDVEGQARELHQGVGNDLAKFNGDGGWILPAPAAFVIDREGIVRFVGVNGDYTQRVEPDDALDALDRLVVTSSNKERAMADTERNKQTVARLFDAFRSGDVDAFNDLIVEDFVQHNPQAGNGLQAIKEFFAPVGPVDVDIHRVIAEGDLVAVHSNLKTWNMAGLDIFRFNDHGKIIEHWDVLQQVPGTTASGNDMFSQLT